MVYFIDYVDHGGNKKSEKKWMEIRRMNHTKWKEPLKTKKGYSRLKESPSRNISYTASDIEWFLKWGMDSFLKYEALVMYPIVL